MTLENKDINQLANAVEQQIAAEEHANPVAQEKARILRMVQDTVAFAVAHRAGLAPDTMAQELYALMGEGAPPELRVMEGQCTHLPHQWLEIRAESRKVEEPRWIFIIDVEPLGIHVATAGCSDILKAAVVIWEPWSVWQTAYIGRPIRGVGITA